MVRWLEILLGYDFQVCHRIGKWHRNADAMSGVTCHPDSCDCYDGRTILQSLPYGSCDACQKKHEQWSSFAEVDDVFQLSARCVEPRSDSVKEPWSQWAKCKTGSWLCWMWSIVELMGTFLCVGIICHKRMFKEGCELQNLFTY